jgi:hypothetical protein
MRPQTPRLRRMGRSNKINERLHISIGQVLPCDTSLIAGVKIWGMPCLSSSAPKDRLVWLTAKAKGSGVMP